MGRVQRFDEPVLTRAMALRFIQDYPDVVYRNYIQEKLGECTENPYAVASLLGKNLHPVLKRALTDGDNKTVCFICEIFRSVKIALFPAEPEPVCSGDKCELIRGRKKDDVRKSKSNRVSKGLPTKRRRRNRNDTRDTNGTLPGTEEQAQEYA